MPAFCQCRKFLRLFVWYPHVKFLELPAPAQEKRSCSKCEREAYRYLFEWHLQAICADKCSSMNTFILKCFSCISQQSQSKQNRNSVITPSAFFFWHETNESQVTIAETYRTFQLGQQLFPSAKVTTGKKQSTKFLHSINKHVWHMELESVISVATL